MAGLFATSAPSMVPATRANAAAVRSRVADIPSAARGLEGQAIFENLARSVQSLQSEVNAIMNVLRRPIPQPSQLAITDQNGKLIAWIGSRVVGGVLYQGLYSTQAYFGGSDPTNANIVINGSSVQITNAVLTISSSGFVSTLGLQTISGNQVVGLGTYDPSGANDAWFGTQLEPSKSITATTNANPDVVTVTAHGYANGDTVNITGALGDTAINGLRIVQNVTANTFTLTTLSGTAIVGNGIYTGGGTVSRYSSGAFFQNGTRSILIRAAGLTTPQIILSDTNTGFKITEDSVNGLVVVGAANGQTITVSPTGNISVTENTASQRQSVLGTQSLNITYGPAGTAFVFIGVGISGGSVQVADGSGNVVSLLNQLGIRTTTMNATTAYQANGVAGATETLVTINAINTTNLQYKDWSGTNQTQAVVTGITTFNKSVSLGIVTS